MIDTLLNRLTVVRRTGTARWVARCPAHDDHSPSLAIAVVGNSRILLHCFAGCGTAEVLAAINLDFSDIEPRKTGIDHFPKVVRRFPAEHVLAAVAHELLVALHIAKTIEKGGPLKAADMTRLNVCCRRLLAGLEIANE